MLKFMKSWCEGIVVAVLISIIIEMIVPEGNNKKYIKVVVGIFMIFVILNPILENINFEFDIENIFYAETIDTSADFNNNMKDVYIMGIEESIKQEVVEKGYFVNFVNITVDANYENIEKIEMEISKKKNISIEPINIGDSKEIQEEDIELKQFIAENYQIPIDQIFIFQN